MRATCLFLLLFASLANAKLPVLYITPRELRTGNSECPSLLSAQVSFGMRATFRRLVGIKGEYLVNQEDQVYAPWISDIAASPKDLELRKEYARFLRTKGQNDFAEFIDKSIELTRLNDEIIRYRQSQSGNRGPLAPPPTFDAEQAKKANEETELIAKRLEFLYKRNAEAWLPAQAMGATSYRWQNGFIEGAGFTIRAFGTEAERVLNFIPTLKSVGLTYYAYNGEKPRPVTTDDIDRAFNSPALLKLEALHLNQIEGSFHSLRPALEKSPYLTNIKTLSLEFRKKNEDSVSAFLENINMPQLEVLNLNAAPSYSGFEAAEQILWAKRKFPKLRKVILFGFLTHENEKPEVTLKTLTDQAQISGPFHLSLDLGWNTDFEEIPSEILANFRKKFGPHSLTIDWSFGEKGYHYLFPEIELMKKAGIGLF